MRDQKKSAESKISSSSCSPNHYLWLSPLECKFIRQMERWKFPESIDIFLHSPGSDHLCLFTDQTRAMFLIDLPQPFIKKREPQHWTEVPHASMVDAIVSCWVTLKQMSERHARRKDRDEMPARFTLGPLLDAQVSASMSGRRPALVVLYCLAQFNNLCSVEGHLGQALTPHDRSFGRKLTVCSCCLICLWSEARWSLYTFPQGFLEKDRTGSLCIFINNALMPLPISIWTYLRDPVIHTYGHDLAGFPSWAWEAELWGWRHWVPCWFGTPWRDPLRGTNLQEPFSFFCAW